MNMSILIQCVMPQNKCNFLHKLKKINHLNKLKVINTNTKLICKGSRLRKKKIH
jgi:hypothetical protein